MRREKCFSRSDGQNQNKLPHPDVLEINHCREGGFECAFSNGDCQYVGAGDLAINRLTNETASTYFPLSHYHGISITIDLSQVSNTLKQIENVIGGLNIDIFSLADKFCKNDTCLVLRSQSEIEHIFSELYCVEPCMIAYYLKVKVLELLMFLNNVSLSDYQEEHRYFSKNQVQIIKEMQAATMLLRDTSDSITKIAAKMGYDNPSKFSDVIKKEFGDIPSEFRKKLPK